MANSETVTGRGIIDQSTHDDAFKPDMFTPIRNRIMDLQIGERLPYEAHESSVVQTIEDEMLRFAQAPDKDAAQPRYEAALVAMRSIPGRKTFVKELDDTLYHEALKALADPVIPDDVKSALVKASMNVGIGGEKSPEVVSVYDKLERLQKDYSATRDIQERAAMVDYLLRVTGDAAKVDAFFRKGDKKQGNVRFLSPASTITAASLAGAISLTLVASPAAAQETGGSSVGSSPQIASISVTAAPEKQVVPTVHVEVAASPLVTPAGVMIKAQTGRNQSPMLPAVDVAVSASGTAISKNIPPIVAQTIQKPAETPIVAISPITDGGSSTSVQPNTAPNIPIHADPTSPTSPEVVAVTPSVTAPTVPAMPNTPDTANAQNAPSVPANPDGRAVIQAQAPDTSVTPKDGETPTAAIARVVQGHDANKAVYIIRATYGSAGNHQAAPNTQLATTVDAYVSDTQAKILAANHGDTNYTNGAITALAYLDAAVNDPTILDANRTVAKDAQAAIAGFATTGEPYHDKLLAQEVAAAKQNLSSDAAGKFAGIGEADQNTIAQLAGYASLAAKTDAEQNAAIQKIKDDEAAAAKAAADAAAKAAADAAAQKAAEAATQNTPETQAAQELIDNAGSATDKRIYTAFQYFMNNGFTAEQATGIVGNLLVESAGTMDPTIKQGGGGPGRGIAQWGSWGTDPQGNRVVAGRFGLLSDFAQGQGKNWDDLGVQLDFIMYELQTTRTAALSEIKSAQNAHDAAYAFMHLFEAPRDQSEKATTTRMNRGLPILNLFIAGVNQINQERAAAAQKAIDDAKAAAAAAAQKAADEAAQALKNGDIRSTLADGAQIVASLKAEHGNVSGKLSPDELAAQPGLAKDGTPYTVQLNPEAMKGYVALAAAFKAHFGYDIRLSDSYRDYAGQQYEARVSPGLAAKPGTSNHGWGLALDFASNIENANSEQSAWMRANAYKFGWIHPTWAHDGNPKDGAEEAWHWEFLGSQATFDVSQ